jgi:hypothetical protein
MSSLRQESATTRRVACALAALTSHLTQVGALRYTYELEAMSDEVHEFTGDALFDLEIRQSAHKHGLSHDDIINCYRYPIVTKVLKSDSSKYLYIGFDTHGRPIELLVNHNGISVIFHAMPLRKQFQGYL